MGGEHPATQMLKQFKEGWIEKLGHKKIKLQKHIERSRQKMANANFEGDLKNFFKRVESGTEHVGQKREMGKFDKFLRDIWEEDDRTTEMPCADYQCKGIQQHKRNPSKRN